MKKLDCLKPGDFVKVCVPVKGKLRGMPTEGERFWCEVKELNHALFRIVGRIDNELLTRSLKYNDVIQFHFCNVYEILPKESPRAQ